MENRAIFGDERPLSPNSSGYAGERESNSAMTMLKIDGASEIDGDKIKEVRNDGSLEGFFDAQASTWVPCKRHVDEV
ncbi:hypothetical protein PVK06_027780 [Gossypium arboreum]|uniref:Uncharacterized protein n=1 Tax=Gossypium arboreum TaxID=29729 RepID=A0ABR0P433_GOSAR|nr:hypothetical protein PVK06_027780 [Gossypium arboreum]